MPLEWEERPETVAPLSLTPSDMPVLRLSLWPHRSLPKKGFVIFIGITLGLICVPLLAFIGTVVLWALLPFLGVAVGGVWYALQRSYHDGEILEELTLWDDRLHLVRHNPRGPTQEWQANPHWVRIVLHEQGGPVENYVTLMGAGREVEIGAFLSPEERMELYRALSIRLARAA
ncbi:MAG: putative membrane protein [Paracoccaceae bacterium]|jgi:uncharacterized membrane protein